jgi:uncharacterized protein with HEPN domain
MTLRDPHHLIRDMIDHAREAIDILGDRSLDELSQERGVTLALTRLVEIIGEAASQLTPAHREKIDGVPWSQIIGMRNRLAHAYREVDTRILWLTITGELAPLIESLKPYTGPDAE